MAAQSYSHGMFAETFAVCGRCVEIIHASLQSLVDRTVDLFLVNYFLAVITFQGRQTHTSVAEYRHPVAGGRIYTVSHFSSCSVVIACRYYFVTSATSCNRECDTGSH